MLDAAYENRVLRSHDGMVEYTLTRSGWEFRKVSVDGIVLNEHYRTVIQVAPESESTDVVLQLTEEALTRDWFTEGKHTSIQEQLAAAKRARQQTRLP